MSEKYKSEDMDRIYEELQKSNDRSVIIVGAALLEDGLENCIASRVRKPTNDAEIGFLFGERGCFGTFSLKIYGAYFLSLIGPEVKRDFDLVRKIRNKAAHNMKEISFENTPEIAGLCRELKFAKTSLPGKATPPDLRGKFLVTVSFYTSALLVRAMESYNELPVDIIEASKDFVAYLDR